MIELEAVSYRYAGYAREALSDVTLGIADGEIVGLVGPNEAGKSTLCLVASGLAPASVGGRLQGTVRVDGTALVDLPTHELATRVGLVFSDPHAQLSGVTATVFEEVAFGPVNLGLPVAETVARTRRALAALGIEPLERRDPGRLSGGEVQLVAIASSLAMEPRHLVLDEPTSELDPAGSRLVGEALRRVAGSGTALLIAEHRTDLLDGLCGRVIALDGGRIVLDGPAGDVLADPRLDTLGVEAPSRIRLARTVATRGLALPAGALP